MKCATSQTETVFKVIYLILFTDWNYYIFIVRGLINYTSVHWRDQVERLEETAANYFKGFIQILARYALQCKKYPTNFW